MSDKNIDTSMSTPKRGTLTLSMSNKGTPLTAPSTPWMPEESVLTAAEEPIMLHPFGSTSSTDEYEGSSMSLDCASRDDASFTSAQTFSVSGGSSFQTAHDNHGSTQYSVEDLTRIVKDMTTKQQDTYFHYLRKREEVKSLESSMLKLANRVGEMNQEADAREKEIEKWFVERLVVALLTLRKSHVELTQKLMTAKKGARNPDTTSRQVTTSSDRNGGLKTNEEIEGLLFKLTELEQQMKEIQTEADDAVAMSDESLDAMKERLDTMSQDHSEQEMELKHGHETRVQKLQAQLTNANTELQVLSKERSDLKETVKTMKIHFQGHDTMLQDLMSEAAEEVNEALAEHKTEMDQLESSHDETCTRLESQMETLNKELEQNVLSKAATEAEMKKLNADMDSTKRRESEWKGKWEQKDNEMKEVEVLLSSLNIESSMYQNTINELEEKIVSLSKAHDESIAKMKAGYATERSWMEAELKKKECVVEESRDVKSLASELKTKIKCQDLEKQVNDKVVEIHKVRSELRSALKVSMGKAKPKKQDDKSAVEEEMKTLTTTYEERLAESEKVKVALQKRISKLNEVQANQRLEADSILKQKDREIDDLKTIIGSIEAAATVIANQSNSTPHVHKAGFSKTLSHCLHCEALEWKLGEKMRQMDAYALTRGRISVYLAASICVFTGVIKLQVGRSS
eukprot:scaffold71585_cov49-Attheya_sp.AAC.2